MDRVNGRLWNIRCACGNVIVAQPSHTSGRCKKCGYEFNAELRRVHGESPSSEKNSSRLYEIWVGARNRCNNPNNHDYKYYGEKGVTFCKEWDSYLAFKEWANNNGYSEELTLDRINPFGNYEPDNCRWATRLEQSRNKRNQNG